MEMTNANSIFVGCIGPVAWVRVLGTASHENAGGVRDFLQDRFEAGWRRFVIDLGDCRGVDSTFIGTLYRIAKRVDAIDDADADAEEVGGVSRDVGVEVLNPSARNERSICKLGLNCLIKITQDDAAWKAERAMIDDSIQCELGAEPLEKEARTELILEAHQALVEANEENRCRFKDVIAFLEEDLVKGGPSREHSTSN